MSYTRLSRPFGLVVGFVLFVAVLAPATATAAPEVTAVEVGSKAGWVQVPLALRHGQQYALKATGRWTVDSRSIPRVGPEGYSADVDPGIYQGCKVAPYPYARILGKVGDGVVFSVGADGAFTANTSGSLFLRINDADACLGDNAGSVKVRVKLNAARAEKTPTAIFAGYAALWTERG